MTMPKPKVTQRGLASPGFCVTLRGGVRWEPGTSTSSTAGNGSLERTLFCPPCGNHTLVAHPEPSLLQGYHTPGCTLPFILVFRQPLLVWGSSDLLIY